MAGLDASPFDTQEQAPDLNDDSAPSPSRRRYDPLAAVAHNVAAAPVDTFIQAQKPQDLTPNLTALTQGLAKLDQGLSSFVQERQQQQDQQDALRGEIDFHRNNAEGYAQATAEGKIPAFASRAYMEGYQKTQGIVAGEDLQQKYDDQYNQAGGGNMSPDQFRQFHTQFLANNLGANQSPYVLQGLMPKITALTQQGQNRYNRDHDSVVREGNYNTVGAAMGQSLDTANADGLQNKTGTNYDAAYNNLMQFRGDYVKRNAPDAGDKLIVDTVVAKAIENRDPKMLDILKRNVPGTTYTFADTPYGRTKYADAVNTLESRGRAAIAREHAEQKEADKLAQNAITTQAMDYLAKNPGQALPEAVLQAGETRNPHFRKDMAEAQKTFNDTQGLENPQAVIQTEMDIMNGGGREALNNAQQNGIVRKPETYTRLATLADNYQKQRDVVDNIRADPTFTNYEKTISRYLGKDLTNPLGPQETPQSINLKSRMTQAVLDWATNHPGASQQERQKAINDIGQVFLSSIKGVEQEQPTLTPQDVEAATQQAQTIAGPHPQPTQPFSGKGTPGSFATPAPLPNAPQLPPEAAKQVQMDPAKVEASKSSLTPAQMTVLQGMAVSRGQSVDDILKDVYVAAVRGGHIVPTPGDADKAFPAPPAVPQPGTTSLRKGAPTPSAPTAPVAQAGPHPVSYTPGQPVGLIGGENSGEQSAPSNAASAITSALRATGSDRPPTSALAYSPKDAKRAASDFTNGLNTASDEDIARARDAFERGLNEPIGQAPTGGYSIATLRDDPKAARILDFVAGPESSGNYNAYYGHAGSTRDLSKMSLQDIRNFMHDRGTSSSATGRYQFMEATLFGRDGKPGLVQRMGISMKDKFTPVLQDTMAIQLLKDRGYEQWKAGKITTNQFADNLAHEWASLPMHHGKSAYEGDSAGNHALVGRQALMDTLGADGDSESVADLASSARGVPYTRAEAVSPTMDDLAPTPSAFDRQPRGASRQAPTLMLPVDDAIGDAPARPADTTPIADARRLASGGTEAGGSEAEGEYDRAILKSLAGDPGLQAAIVRLMSSDSYRKAPTGSPAFAGTKQRMIHDAITRHMDG